MKDSHYFSRSPSAPYKAKKIKITLRGHYIELYTAPGVFSSNHVDRGTQHLCENMKLPTHGNILDFGTGIGIIALVIGKESPSTTIFATDINPRAIQLARRNVKLNNITNCNIIKRDGYESFDFERFSTIVSNPPYSVGWKFIQNMIIQGEKYLKPKGTMQLVCLHRKGGDRVQQILQQTFGNVEILTRKSGYRVFFSEKL